MVSSAGWQTSGSRFGRCAGAAGVGTVAAALGGAAEPGGTSTNFRRRNDKPGEIRADFSGEPKAFAEQRMRCSRTRGRRNARRECRGAPLSPGQQMGADRGVDEAIRPREAYDPVTKAIQVHDSYLDCRDGRRDGGHRPTCASRADLV